MKIIISERQYKLLRENENEIFVRKFFEKKGQLPQYNQLAQMKNNKVGDIYPEHSKAHLKISNFIKNEFPDFSKISNKIAGENDIIFGSNKGIGKPILSFDGKHKLESNFENIFYNTFALEGLNDELTYEPKEFMKDCKKKPDFLWKQKNTIIEIGGMESESYWENLTRAEECFKSKGYNVVIFNVRKDQKKHDFLKFYKDVCDEFGFPVRDEVISDVNLILKLKPITLQQIRSEVDKFATSFERKRGETDMLSKNVKTLGYSGIKDYKRKQDLGRFKDSVTGIRKRIVELINQKHKIDDIAKILSSELGREISPRLVDHNISIAKDLGELPKVATNKEYLDAQRRKSNYPTKDELETLIKNKISWKEMGRIYGVSDNAMRKRAQVMGLIEKK